VDPKIQAKHLSPDALLSKRFLDLAATARIASHRGAYNTEPQDYIKDVVKKTS
jgi:hypothetical protein